MSQRIHKYRAWDIEKKKWIGDTGTTFNGEEPTEGQVALLLSGNLRVFSAEHIGDIKDCKEGECLVAIANSEYASVHPATNNYKKQYVLMQFTGLHDKNGVEIYEGDVVSIDCWNGGNGITEPNETDNFTGVVIYDINGFGLRTEGCKENETEVPLMENNRFNTIEILGNFYEHPELLKGEK